MFEKTGHWASVFLHSFEHGWNGVVGQVEILVHFLPIERGCDSGICFAAGGVGADNCFSFGVLDVIEIKPVAAIFLKAFDREIVRELLNKVLDDEAGEQPCFIVCEAMVGNRNVYLDAFAAG